MNANAPLLLSLAGVLGGCHWVAGIGDTTVAEDAGQPSGDASLADAPAGDGMDAGVLRACPEPCVADAVAQFAFQQGGTSEAWRYLEEHRGAFGTDSREMSLASRDAALLWTGSGAQAPAIVHCPSSPADPGCEGVGDKLLLESGDAGNTYPALGWTVPENAAGRYRLAGDWRVAPSAPTGVAVTLLLVRNSRFDSVLEERFTTRSQPAAFDLEVDVLPGDVVRLIAIPDDALRVPLAVSFYVSEARSPGQCQMASNFAPAPDSVVFPDLCGSASFQDGSDTDTTCENPDPLCPPTSDLPAPPGVPGRARHFETGASVGYLGAPNRYDGDFSVQFWGNLLFGGNGLETVLGDADCAGGLRLLRQHRVGTISSDIRLDVFYPDPVSEGCPDGGGAITTRLIEEEWRFFRITRSTATGTVRLCIDGAFVGAALVPGDADMSATEPMWLGRDPPSPAAFRGAIADLRVFDVALPCAEP